MPEPDYTSRFFPLFSTYIYQLCSNIESIKTSTLSVLQDFEDDGVVYLELRTTPRAIAPEAISKSLYVDTVLSCIEGFESSKMQTKLILSIDRRNSASEALEVLELAIKYRSRGVVGIDLCGDPSKGDISVYKGTFARANALGFGVTIHFAETPASSSRLELETLLSFKPDRLGHVIDVPEDLKREIARRRLGLELCLSCNVLAKLTTGGFPDHHFGYWRDKGCSIALCVSCLISKDDLWLTLQTDDVGVFNSPLSNEYLIAAQHFGLSREDLIQLSFQALSSIFGTPDDKERLQRILTDFRRKAFG